MKIIPHFTSCHSFIHSPSYIHPFILLFTFLFILKGTATYLQVTLLIHNVFHWSFIQSFILTLFFHPVIRPTQFFHPFIRLDTILSSCHSSWHYSFIHSCVLTLFFHPFIRPDTSFIHPFVLTLFFHPVIRPNTIFYI